MKLIVTLLFSAATASAAAADPAESWLNSNSLDIHAAKTVTEVPRDFFFEVPVSMLEEAERRLESEAAVKLQSYDVESLSRKHFSCIKGATPFLVRAVYTNGNTGSYWLKRLDSALWVSHNPLGASTGTHRSALIVCLRFNPRIVYVTAGGGM